MIEIRYDDAEVQAALKRLAARVRDMRATMRSVGEAVRSDIMERFDTSTAPAGENWKQLTLAAIVTRARRHAHAGMKKRGGATLKKFSDNAKPLLDTGALRNSIRTLEITSSSVTVGTRMPYAAIHHFGGKAGRGRKVTIPARPYMGISASGKTEIMAIIRRHMESS